MISIALGRWSSAHGNLFTRKRIYFQDWRWTPFVRISWRYPKLRRDTLRQPKPSLQPTPKNGAKEMFVMNKKFTEEDFDCCWPYYKEYFIDVLNGEYTLVDARADLRSLIGSSHDKRVTRHERNKTK